VSCPRLTQRLDDNGPNLVIPSEWYGREAARFWKAPWNLDACGRFEYQILLVMCGKRRQWRIFCVHQFICEAKLGNRI